MIIYCSSRTDWASGTLLQREASIWCVWGGRRGMKPGRPERKTSENNRTDRHFSRSETISLIISSSSGERSPLDRYQLFRDPMWIIQSGGFFMHRFQFTKQYPFFSLLLFLSFFWRRPLFVFFLSCFYAPELCLLLFSFPCVLQVDEPTGTSCYRLHARWQGASSRRRWDGSTFQAFTNITHLPINC